MISRRLLIIILLFSPLSLVRGAVSPSVTVAPSKLEIMANPGEIVHREFVITNQSGRNLNLSLRFENLVDAPTYPLTPYLSATKRSFVLPRGGRAIVPIIIGLPKNIGPGGFYGAAVFSITSAANTPVGTKTKVVTRLAPLIFLRVNGEVKEAGALLTFNVSWPTFYLTYQNTGNVYLNPYGLIAIKNRLTGRQISLPIDPWFVLPGTTRIREISATEKLGAGWYQTHLLLHPGFNNLTEERVTNFLIITPTAIWGISLGLIILLALAIILMKRRRRIVLAIIFVLAFANVVRAQVASSPNYRLQADSLNFGGILSTSPNYNLEDTLGEIATGNSASTNYGVNAGYQQMVFSMIAITAPSDVSLSAIAGTGVSSGSAVWTVTTDNSAGYTLSIKTGNSPALVSGSDNFSDYSPSGANPDYTWTVGATASAFGFSPEGTDIASRYLDNGSSCGVGGSDAADHCWDGFSTSDRTIASRSTSNTPSGIATTVRLKAEIGSTKTQPAGSYAATLTVTATPR